MQSEYVKKLEAFAMQAGGDFNHSSQPTTSLNSKGWSKVEIRIPHRGTDLYYIAFSGPNSAEVHSGFYVAGKLPLKLFCRITQRDGFADLISTFSSYKMKSGRPAFDKKLHTSCNNKTFLLKLTGNQEAAKFLEKSIQRPLRFEVMSNEKGILKHENPSAMIISLNSNEWMVDRSMLTELLSGFRILVDHLC